MHIIDILLTGRPQKREPVRFPLALEKLSIHFKPYLRPARPKLTSPYISAYSVAGRGKLSVLQVSRLRDVFEVLGAIWREARPAMESRKCTQKVRAYIYKRSYTIRL